MTKRDFRELIKKDLKTHASPKVKHEFRIFYTQSVFDDIANYASTEREVGGILVGNVYRDDQGIFLHVDGVIQGLHAREGETEVTMTYDTWQHVHKEMESSHAGKEILGWYHTHPSFGIFLSEKDQFIHNNFFDQPHHIALVYDPVNREHGTFIWRSDALWRVRRYWIGESEHLWDGPREIPQPQERTEKQTVAPTEASTDKEPELDFLGDSSLINLLITALIAVLIGGMCGFQLNVWRSTLNARADGAVEAVESLNVDLLEAIGIALGDNRYVSDLEEAEDVIEDVIAALQTDTNPEAVDEVIISLTTLLDDLEDADHRRVVAEDLVHNLQAVADASPSNPSEYLEQLRQQQLATAQLLRVLLVDALSENQLTLASNLLKTINAVDPVNAQSTEILLREFIVEVAGIGDIERAMSLVDMAKNVYPDNIEAYDAILESISNPEVTEEPPDGD